MTLGTVPRTATGPPAEETLEEGYRHGSASSEKKNLRPWTLWLGSKPSCIKHQALVLLAWTSVMLGEARFRHHRREVGQAALGPNRISQVGAVSWSQQKHWGSSFLAKARTSQFDKKMDLHIQEAKSALSWLNSEPHLDTSPSVSENSPGARDE